MAKQMKKPVRKTTAPRFLTAAQLKILPEEREALIAFVKSHSLGRIIEVDGNAHYYNQRTSNDRVEAQENECGTAGCVAGFVFAHVTQVQNKRQLRGKRQPHDYLERAAEEVKLLNRLYTFGSESTLERAKEVVQKVLTTGQVYWYF